MHTAWTDDDDQIQVDANLRWLAGFYQAMAPYVSDSAYQNFVDPDLSDWPRAYYGDNYSRLVRIKKTFDPDDVFHFEQSIRP